MTLRDRIAARTPDELKQRFARAVHRVRWRRSPIAPIVRRFVREHGLVVRDGPFRGMRLDASAVDRIAYLTPLLMGSYERELHAHIESIAERGFDWIVDIGAADGYYAVGLALRSPRSRVIAYEMDWFPVRVLKANATANGVADRVEVRGECGADELRALPADGSLFVMCDVEGAEVELMDPVRAPRLRDATLLVELHDHAVAGAREAVLERFSRSHRVELVTSEPRWADDYPLLAQTPGFGYIEREIASREFRGSPCAWALLTPRAG
jgi:hypothetical protein